MESEIRVGSAEESARRFVERLAAEAGRGLAARRRFVLAIPGGSVARAFLPLFARADLDWERLDLVWTDERAVAPDDPESNFGLARSLWLGRAARRPRLHRFHGEATDLVEATERGERAIAATLGRPPRLDLALVGVGTDGHVASLFPGSPTLAERKRFVVAVADAPKPPPRRLSLSPAAFAATDLLVVAAFGGEKAAVLAAAFGPSSATSDLPIAEIARLAARRLVLVDPPAAAALAET